MNDAERAILDSIHLSMGKPDGSVYGTHEYFPVFVAHSGVTRLFLVVTHKLNGGKWYLRALNRNRDTWMKYEMNTKGKVSFLDQDPVVNARDEDLLSLWDAAIANRCSAQTK